MLGEAPGYSPKSALEKGPNVAVAEDGDPVKRFDSELDKVLGRYYRMGTTVDGHAISWYGDTYLWVDGKLEPLDLTRHGLSEMMAGGITGHLDKIPLSRNGSGGTAETITVCLAGGQVFYSSIPIENGRPPKSNHSSITQLTPHI